VVFLLGAKAFVVTREKKIEHRRGVVAATKPGAFEGSERAQSTPIGGGTSGDETFRSVCGVKPRWKGKRQKDLVNRSKWAETGTSYGTKGGGESLGKQGKMGAGGGAEENLTPFSLQPEDSDF